MNVFGGFCRYWQFHRTVIIILRFSILLFTYLSRFYQHLVACKITLVFIVAIKLQIPYLLRIKKYPFDFFQKLNRYNKY